MHSKLSLLFLCCSAMSVIVPDPLHAASHNRPRGVVLVLIDDIGYGDIDCLFPSDLETPRIDALAKESVRLTDFHVGTTCSPSRASLMTGRSVNAGGVWHTVGSRELLRENEQTVADVFKANGWRTGIFGKWHLGEGYPFSPRFRGFDVSVIHGGGGVGQAPDFWGNDYYSNVDRSGEPTMNDSYLENGVYVSADRFCTDYWFIRAEEFVRECVQEDEPFFCYIPTNAAHAPFNAPHGFKDGFDGLIENIDDNMGRFDEFLISAGIKDDVLMIFTSDNGTTGRRLGGLRGAKTSHYDGGHNVPCFMRWKNGGIGGDSESARDVSSLTAAMDFLPTFVDLFWAGHVPEGGRPLHGVSIKEMLLDSSYVPSNRTIVVDTQRSDDLMKWKLACVLQDEVASGNIVHKWRLLRTDSDSDFELYDFLDDRDTNNNIARGNSEQVNALSTAYDSWWSDISQGWEKHPAFVLNEDHEAELSLFSLSWIGGSPWHQDHIRSASKGTGKHAVRFDRSGRYRFELRRWPREDGGAIDGHSYWGNEKQCRSSKRE